MKRCSALAVFAVLAGAGCDFDAATQACLESGHCVPLGAADAASDAGPGDAGARDAGSDAGLDGGTDAGPRDGGPVADGGSGDSGSPLDAGNGPVEVVLSGPAVIDAGQCVSFRLVALDAAGTPAPVSMSTPVMLSVVPAFDAGPQFFPTPGGMCFGTPTSTVILPASGTSVQVGVQGTGIGRYTVNTTALGQGVPNSLGISAGVPQIIAITSPPQVLQSNGCSAPLRVQLEDGLGDPILAAGNIALTFPPGVTPIVYYSDLNCISVMMSAQISAGSGYTDFTVRAGLNAAQVIIDAGFWIAAQNETVLSGGPTLSFGTAPISTTVGACSGPVLINASVGPAQATPVVVTSTTGNTAYYSDPVCLQSIAEPGLMAGQTNTQFHFIETHAGALTLNASATGYEPAVQTETVQPAAPDHYGYFTAPLFYPVNVCTGPVTLELFDVYGNVSPTNVPIICQFNLGASTTWYAPNCVATINSLSFGPGSSQASFAFKSTSINTAVHPLCNLPDGGPIQVEAVCAVNGTHCAQAQECCSQACDAGTCG